MGLATLAAVELSRLNVFNPKKQTNQISKIFQLDYQNKDSRLLLTTLEP
jgi:hypothetical protein